MKGTRTLRCHSSPSWPLGFPYTPCPLRYLRSSVSSSRSSPLPTKARKEIGKARHDLKQYGHLITSYLISFRAPRSPVLLQHIRDTFGLKARMHGLIPPTKNDARQSVKLFKAYRRRWVERHEAHDGRLDVRWWAEVIFAYVHYMVDLGV